MGTAFCAGVVVDKSYVLTTASCALLHANISVETSECGHGGGGEEGRGHGGGGQERCRHQGWGPTGTGTGAWIRARTERGMGMDVLATGRAVGTEQGQRGLRAQELAARALAHSRGWELAPGTFSLSRAHTAGGAQTHRKCILQEVGAVSTVVLRALGSSSGLSSHVPVSHHQPPVVSAPGLQGAPGEPEEVLVSRRHVHPRYDQDSGENDLSLLELAQPLQCPDMGRPICTPEGDFAEHVLVPGTGGFLSGWNLNGSALGKLPMWLPVTALDSGKCAHTLNVTVTTRTYCERPAVGTCPGVRWGAGSAVVRWHRGTWFLSGLLSEAPPGQTVLLLTKVSRYALWFRQVMG